MAYEITVGTCSICGGRVALDKAWFATTPQLPKCTNCGAIPEKPYGPVIPMKKSNNSVALENLIRKLRIDSCSKLHTHSSGKIAYLTDYKNIKSQLNHAS